MSMVNCNELRLGNLIQLDPNKKWVYGDRDGNLPEGIFSVKSISEEGINYTFYHDSGEHWESFDKYIGIPISDLWLIDFGFEKSDTYDFGISLNKVPMWSKGGLCIILSEGEYWYSVKRWDGGTAETFEAEVKIEFVHTLQNLYFCLEEEHLIYRG